jgi:hypothetical protein
MGRGIREFIVSAACLIAVLAGLIAADSRVRDRLTAAFSTATHSGATEWTARVDAIGSAVLRAARDQSIEHAPMLIFAAVAAVLVVFMLRT